MIFENPLRWPDHQKQQTADVDRQYGRFSYKGKHNGYDRNKAITLTKAVERLRTNLEKYNPYGRSKSSRVNTDMVVITTNQRAVKGGDRIYSNPGTNDPAVAIYFELDGHPRCIACDTFTAIEQNIAAIAAYIESLRMQERYGVATTAQQFMGFDALPGKGESSAIDWSAVFGVDADASYDVVRSVYRTLVKKHHPDRGDGGDRERYETLNKAWSQFEATHKSR